MKPITGEVISSKPISLSKAAAVLAKFASSENGATPEISEYVFRSSASFGELVEYYRRLEGRKDAKGETLGGGKGERRDLDGLGREKEPKPRKNEGSLTGEERKEGRMNHKEKKRDRGALEGDGREKRANGEGCAEKSRKKNREAPSK